MALPVASCQQWTTRQLLRQGYVGLPVYPLPHGLLWRQRQSHSHPVPPWRGAVLPQQAPAQLQPPICCAAQPASNGIPPSRSSRSSSRGSPSASPTRVPSRVQEAVLRLRQAMRIPSRGLQDEEIEVSGAGRHLGIKITWSIRWRADGAFQEEISGKQLGFRWGYDGRPDSCCWEVDSSGVARVMELDDHELLLLGAWIRTGLWLQPHLISRLDVRLLDPGDAVFMAGPGRSASSSLASSQRSRSRSVSEQQAVASNGPSSNGYGINSQGNDHSSNGNNTVINSSTSDTQAPSSSSSDDGASLSPRVLVLGVRLKGGKLESRVRVCPHTWTLLGVDQPLCGDSEVWQFGSWQGWTQHNVFHPVHVSHEPIAGSQNVYVTQHCKVQLPSPLSHFQCPVTPLLPADTTFKPGVPPELPVWRAGSSHLLVRPTINGKDGGYMILDTGASGFVITPDAAVSLGLEPFGEMYAASMTGKVAAQFVQAKSWCLGPLQVSSPVMMTMAVDGLVTGGPPGGDIIGIVGYDIFRRAVVELPAMRPQSHAVPLQAAAATASRATGQQQAPHGQLSVPASSWLSAGHSTHSTGGWGASTQHYAGMPGQSHPSQQQLQQQQLLHGNTVAMQGHGNGTQGPNASLTPYSAGTVSDGMADFTGGGSTAAGHSGPLPFLQGLINAASAGLGVGGWGGSRSHVHSGTTTTTSTQQTNTGSPAAPPPMSSFMTGQIQPPSAANAAAGTVIASANPSAPVCSPQVSGYDAPPSSVVQHNSNGNGSTSRSSSGSTLSTISSGSGISTVTSDGESSNQGNGTSARAVIDKRGPQKSEKKREDERRLCQQFTMRLYHPGEYGGPEAEGWSWHDFKLVASLPHVEVRFPGSQGQPLTTLLMVDSGAGGADIVLHTRAMRELDLLSKPTESFLRGVGGVVKDDHKDKDKCLQTVDMPWVELLGLRFSQVSCMHVGSSGLDISLYASGILCGNMLSRLPTTYDYARKRLGIRLPPPPSQSHGQADQLL